MTNLTKKEMKPIKHKDVVLLEDLQMKHPMDLTEKEKVVLEKLTLRRNIYGEV